MIRAIAGTARRRWARATGSKSLHRSSSSKADSQHTTSDTKEEEVDPPHLKRLMYHAKQRGWLELDLMVGNWAETNRRALATNPALMADFEELLAIENPDMYKYLTGQMKPPKAEAALERNTVYRAIRAEVEARGVKPSNKEWLLSGWHDK